MEASHRSVEARYAEILSGIDPAYLERTADESGRLSSPFLVSGPTGAAAHRIMVVGREFGGRGWRVPYEGGGPETYVAAALVKHRNFLREKLAKPARAGTFFNFMKRLAKTCGQDGLIYSNLFCFDFMGRDPRRCSHFPMVKHVSKLLLDAQIEHFQPATIVFANGMDSVGIRRDFYPISGEAQVCRGQRNWEHEGIPKGHLWEFELHGRYRCYRIHHPSAQSSMAARARRRLLEILSETAGSTEAKRRG
jgi:hypothetical protein